jgi:chromosome partitioning protein
MQVYVIANPKGGVGKSTLATNLAGLLARRYEEGQHGIRVMLGDLDRQQSSRFWLERRPPVLPVIHTWETPSGKARPPQDTTHVVLDTPAGLHGDKLKECLKLATRVLVPIQPSMFDILATKDFFDELSEMKSARKVSVGFVAMRVDERTLASEELKRFLAGANLPLIATLRDTQNYVQLAAHGMTLFDVAPSRVEKDLQQWRLIESWLGLVLPPTLD